MKFFTGLTRRRLVAIAAVVAVIAGLVALVMAPSPAPAPVAAAAQPVSVENQNDMLSLNGTNGTVARPAIPTVAPATEQYTVRRNDTLSLLAQARGTDWQTLFRLNADRLTNPNLIRVGQTLTLPVAVSQPAQSTTAVIEPVAINAEPAAPVEAPPADETPAPAPESEPAPAPAPTGWTHPFPARNSCGGSGSDFGPRKPPAPGASDNHRGQDMSNQNAGSPVLAASGGTVHFAGWRGKAGITVIIEHDNGVGTLYAHLQEGSLNVSDGDRVEVGEHIADVGATGIGTGPHLHFAVMRDMSEYIDPVPYMAERGAPLCNL